MRNPWLRRPFTVASCALLLAALLALWPMLLPLALVTDLLRRSHLGVTRALIFITFYLAMELVGVGASVLLWAGHGGPWGDPADRAWVQRHFRLQQWWSGQLFALAIKLWKIDLQVEGEEASAPGRGPLLVFIRHAGMIDVLLPSLIVANRHDLLLRYVLDAQLLVDPCLDIVGHRLGNAFIQRSSGDPEAQVARVVAQMGDLGEGEGALLYPEGARFTRERKARVLARMEEKGELDLLERSRRLQHLMPPKLGGALGLLKSNPRADVLFFAHAGLDRLQSFSRVLDGTAVGTIIQIKLWRIPRADIPDAEPDQIDWLFRQWQEMDGWVGERLVALKAR